MCQPASPLPDSDTERNGEENQPPKARNTTICVVVSSLLCAAVIHELRIVVFVILTRVLVLDSVSCCKLLLDINNLSKYLYFAF